MKDRTPIFLAIHFIFLPMLGVAAPPDAWIEIDPQSGAHVVRWDDPTDGEEYRLASSESLAANPWLLEPLTATAAQGGGWQQVVASPTTDQNAPARKFYRLQAEEPNPDADAHTFVPGTQIVRFNLPVDPDEPEGEQQERNLHVFIPDSYAPPSRLPGGAWPCPDDVGYPMAIILHGSGQTAGSFLANHPDLITQCNAADMILVVPQGEFNPLTGNYGWNSAERLSQRDDLRLLVVLRELALRVLYVDPNRVHVGGFSNGGVMSMLATHSLPRLFASSAAVGSSIRSENLKFNVTAEVPEPMAAHAVMMVNAKDDPTRPFGGGVANQVLQSSYSDAQLFLSSYHCGGMNPVTTTGPGVPFDWTRDQWCPPPGPDCAIGYEVNTVALEKAGHIWPDADDPANFDANHEVVDFFQRQSIKPVNDYGEVVAIPETAGGSRGPLPEWNIPVAFDLPSSPATMHGLVVFCHGPGIDHESFMDFTEMTAFAQDVYGEGFGWVAYSADHATQLWDLQNGPASNEDILNLLRILQKFNQLGYINGDTPIIPVGFDRGAHFALLAAHLLHAMDFPVGGCGLLNPDWSQALPPAAAQAKAQTLVPAWSFTQENDAVAHPVAVWNYHQTLRYRHPGLRTFSIMDIGREKCPDADRFDRILPVVDGDAIIDHLEDEGIIDASGHRAVCRREIGGALAGMSPPNHLGYSAQQEAEIFTQIQVMFAAHHPEGAGDTRFFEYLEGMIGDPGDKTWTDCDIPPAITITPPNLGDPVGP